jgi:hypothetical protein
VQQYTAWLCESFSFVPNCWSDRNFRQFMWVSRDNIYLSRSISDASFKMKCDANNSLTGFFPSIVYYCQTSILKIWLIKCGFFTKNNSSDFIQIFTLLGFFLLWVIRTVINIIQMVYVIRHMWRWSYRNSYAKSN